MDTQTLTIACIDPLQITTESLPGGEVGSLYNQQLTAKGGVPCSGGPGDYVWALQSGFFPPGLTLNANGTITGTPTSPGLYDFLVRVTDCDTPTPETVTKNLSITVNLVESDRFLCVDGINGDDATGDGTTQRPFKTLNRALAYTSANNLNSSLPRIGAIRVAGTSPSPLVYHENIVLDAGNETDVDLLGGWTSFCASRGNAPNARIKGLSGNAPTIRTLGLSRDTWIELFEIEGNNAPFPASTAIFNGNPGIPSSPTIARNIIRGGNASGANAISVGIYNNTSSPLIIENDIYGGTGAGESRGVWDDAGSTSEIRDNTIDGGDPSGGGTTTSAGVRVSYGLNRRIYDNTITGGTGINAYGIWIDPAPGVVRADIARNTIDCEGGTAPLSSICAGIYVRRDGSATINANKINTNSSATGNRGNSTRGIWVDNLARASVDGNNDIDGGEGFSTSFGILIENLSIATIGGTTPGEPNSISGGGCASLSTDDTWGIKVSSGSVATIQNNTISGGCGINTSTGIGVDPAFANISGNTIEGGRGNISIGIHYNSSTGNITSNTVTGSIAGTTSLGIGILVENGTSADQPVIGSAGNGNDIQGSISSLVSDAIGVWCVNADPNIQNNDLITGGLATNESIGIFLDDCDNVAVSNNTRIEGGSTDDTVGWSVGIRADFSTNVTISNNPMITGGGSLVSTGILLFGSNATISGNTVNAGASTSINEGIVFSGSGGTVTNNTIDANGAGGLHAYGVRTFGCSNPALGPAGGNTFQGASGNGRHLSDENIPLPVVGCAAITINAAGNTWSEAPAPAGLQCGPGNDSFPGTRNFRVLNAGNCIQF